MLAKLHQNRQHGRKVLKGCAKLIEIQRQELNGQTSMCSESSAGHAGEEHPLCALSWKEPSMRRMVSLCGGEKFRVDGCRYGMYSRRGQGPIQKPWSWFSSSEAVRKAIQKRCQHGSGEHVSMNNREKVASATYPPKLCRTLAKAIMGELFVELRNKVHVYVQDEYRENAKRRKTNPEVPVNEPPEFDGNLFPDVEPADTEAPENQQALEPEDPNQHKEGSSDADASGPSRKSDSLENKLRVIHANLGHPSNQVLVRTLKEAGASAEVLKRASEFRCLHCARRGHAQPHRTSQVSHATRKWETISVDTFWWHSPHKDEKGNPFEHVVGISFMDEASDYQVATIVRSGTSKQGSVSSEEFKTALAKDWLRILPKPGNIRFDDEGAFRDQKLIEWIEAQAIRVSVIAGEAAWQVGKHSRHLEVLKENMSLLSSEVGPQAKAEELLALSLASKNEMHNVQGYSPNQWVFGQDKTRVQSFLQNGDNMATSSLRDRNEQ